MEAKFLASALSFLSIFLAVYAQSIASVTENDSDESSESSVHVIYYGDLNVNIGQPFEITCIIPITAKVHWMKNGESITRHNLRHGRDDHSYTLSETAFEGEKHKIEAHLNVRHALKVHDGRYQCTKSAHNGPSHVLHVRGAGGKEQPSSTESGTYQTIDEMTPSSANEIFTKTWKEQQHQQQLPPHKQHKQHNAQQHNYVPTLLAGNASSEYGLIYGYEGQPAAPTSRYSNNDLTTPWHTGGQQGGGIGGGIHRIYSATPPDIPPPRFGLMEQTVAPPEPPTIQLYNQTLLPHHRQQQQLPHQHVPLDTATDSSASATTLFTTAQQHQHLHAHQHQQQLLQLQQQQQKLQQQQLQLQQQHQHTLNAYQLPLPPQPPAQSPLQPVTPPHHHSEKYQTYSPHFVPPALGGGVTQAPNYFTTGYNNNNNYGPMQQQPKTFLPIKKGPDTLVPNYDNVEMQMKFFEIRSPLKLTCNLKNIESDEPLIWKRENVSVTADEKLRGRFKLIPAERTFIIEKTDINDAGNYSCEFKGVSKEFHVISKVIVRVPSNTAVVEGEKMVITCTVLGYKPRLSWSIIGTNYTNLTNSTDRYILKKDDNGVENALLTLENVTLDDRGEYRCYGRNEANDYGNNGTNTVASDSTTVRVKGKFAALWPFLGICAEVIILCLIIFIYEKRRNKSELEESDTDPQEQ